MGKSSPSPAPTPDPSAVARQQAQSNAETAVAQAYLNNVNQVTPYGTLTYTPTDDHLIGSVHVPTFTATQQLNPAGQRLQDTNMATTQATADLANAYTGRIADATSKPFTYDGLPAAPVYNEDYRRQQLNAILSRNQSQMDRDRAALEQQLADRGVGMQDPAYRTAMDQYQRGVNDFRLGADLQSGQAAAQQYQLEGNTRDRAIQEMSNLRTQPINEVAALLGTGTGVKDPTFVNTPQTQIAPTDVIGAYNSAAQQKLAQQQMANQQNNAMMGGLFGLGSAGITGAGMYFGGAAML